jgi:hypothetical protein
MLLCVNEDGEISAPLGIWEQDKNGNNHWGNLYKYSFVWKNGDGVSIIDSHKNLRFDLNQQNVMIAKETIAYPDISDVIKNKQVNTLRDFLDLIIKREA